MKYVLLGIPLTKSPWKRLCNWWWRRQGGPKQYPTHFYVPVRVHSDKLEGLARFHPFGRVYWWDWSGDNLEEAQQLASEYNTARVIHRLPEIESLAENNDQNS